MATQTDYGFAVWGTQGGGLVRLVGERYIFVEAPPEVMELTVGDELPEEWGLAPANELARREMERDEWGEYLSEHGLCEGCGLPHHEGPCRADNGDHLGYPLK